MIRALPRATPVDHYRAPLAQRLPAWVIPAGLVAGAVLMVALAIATVSARHRARQAELAVCTARLELFYVRNPVLRKGRVPFADPCHELRVLSARTEALKAIDHVIALLRADRITEPLERRIAVATLEHAKENVEAIQETKRPRRAKPAAEEGSRHG